MSNFATKFEESFYNLMQSKGIKCIKIQENKKDAVPDFLCELNNYQVIFELKELNESGTTEWLGQNFVIQKITIKETINRFMEECTNKFLNKNFKYLDSALLFTNHRPIISFEGTLWPEIEKAARNNIIMYPEIGNFIFAGYNEPSNSITALHIFENKKSKRVIKKDFWYNFNYKIY
jgi:hypothetical protein